MISAQSWMVTADSLESHELAHQWFGDYVTCRSWSDIWLNESFATYFQAMWDEHSLGRDDFLYSDIKSNQDQYYQAWRRGLRRPIVTKNYVDPEAMFDTYAYPRGGAVLHMLRKTLGDENWWRAINHYLTKNAHQPVETEQFRVAIEEATGQSMDWFFDEWVYKMGHPVFRVTQNYAAAAKTLSLIVKQEQKPDATSPYPQATLFRMPVEIEIATASGTHIEHGMIEPKEEQTLTFAVDSDPLLVNFDYGGTIIKELIFDKTLDQLTYQLAHDDDPLGRLFALNALATRARTASDDEKRTIVAAVAKTVKEDKFWGVRSDAATSLSATPDANGREALISATKDPKAAVRVRAIQSLAATKDTSLASVYLQSLNDQSYSVFRAAATALGATKNAGAYDALVKFIDAPSWHDTVRGSALLGLSLVGDARAYDLGIKYSAIGNPPSVRAAAITIIGTTGKNDPRSYPMVAEAFEQAFMTGNFQLAPSAALALVSLGDPRGLDLIKATKEKMPGNSQLKNFLNQIEAGLQNELKKTAPKP